MRRIRGINLISFCALVLFVDNNGVTEGHSVKDFFKALRGLSQIKNLRHGILPGTLWCGRGNIARNDSELGVYDEMDTCCRTHDRCKDSINPKATKYGLYNKYICRSSLCECDLQFYDCLMRVHGLYASTVGKIYFKKCKQCFRTYYDSEECIREGLDINEEPDRKGRRVFCAKFDQNPKWEEHRHKATSPRSIYIDELLNWPDDGAAQFDSQSYFANDRKYSVDEEDAMKAIEDNY
ncbi:phospholipase A2-like [Formica exsecta]|uniref:phospholipase A2-like n=1 Tax=Formica exsecta TaxID=72781 RepID=UPI0011449537|nr:phospholipase A2-like [Formica exsecta]